MSDTLATALHTALNASLYRESLRLLAESRRLYLNPMPWCRCIECHYRRAYARAEKARVRREKARKKAR